MVVALLACLSLGFSLPLPDRLPASLGDALLQVRLANMDRAAMADWLRRRPFAAVLPIQPMLIQPLTPPLAGLELTFRRKPSSEKGGQDGGLRFAVSDAACEGEGEGEGADGASDGERAVADAGSGVLLVTRISEGQYTAKMFSEKKLLRKLVTDLEQLPAECGAVTSVVDLTLQQD